MARLTQSEIAQKFALQGNIKSALNELSSLYSKGDVGASASLAEIAAFQGHWEKVLEYVRVVFGAPSCLYTLNVYADMVMLVMRAAVYVGKWNDIQLLAKFALSKLTGEEKDEARIRAIHKLLEFATHKGEGRYLNLDEEHESEEVRKEKFESALGELSKSKKKQFHSSEDRLNHVFGLAMVYNYPKGAVNLYDQERMLPTIFDSVAFTASALARSGRSEEAWDIIRSGVHLWWPVEVTQIAPVVLLTDESINLLMTPERCEEILRTVRGPEALIK